MTNNEIRKAVSDLPYRVREAIEQLLTEPKRDVVVELKKEAEELGRKVYALNSFLSKSGVENLVGKVQYALLLQQKHAMDSYATILRQRIANLESK